MGVRQLVDAESPVLTLWSIKSKCCSSVNALASVKRGRTWSQQRLLVDMECRSMQLRARRGNSPLCAVKQGGVK